MRFKVEIWRPCTYPVAKTGLYEISSQGKIRNAVTKKNKKMHKDQDGYLRAVCMTKDNDRRCIPIHRLVAWEFVDGFSDATNIVNHKDAVINNNYFGNLEWCDTKYNYHHAYDLGLIQIGESHYKNKYPEEMIHSICRKIVEGMSQGDIYHDIMIEFPSFKVTKRKSVINLIKDIRRRKVWNHVNKRYKY